jgi:uncharacterized protein (DUF58 family)
VIERRELGPSGPVRGRPGTSTVARHEDTLRQLELLVTRKLDGLLNGDHEGLMRGPGGEAGDGRMYQPGDDARRIDWSLTARSNATHVRDTIADRELETWLVIDGTASLDFGTAKCEKRDLVLASVAAFGFLTARDGNRIAAVCFDGNETDVLPPRSGRDAVLAMLRRIERRDRASEGSGSLAQAIRRAWLAARRRGLIVVVSDLLDGSDWPRELKAAAARHDVIVVQVTDPREAELPPVGLLTLVDPETGRRQEVQTNNRQLRKRFADAAAEQRTSTARAVRASGAAHMTLSTDRDWLLDVVRFTVARRRRR